VNVFHHHLEPIEASCLGDLDLSTETLSEIFKDDSIGGCEKGENVLDEVLLVVIELFPVLDILGKIDFFGCPKGRLLVLVHAPDVVVLDWEKNKAIGVLLEKRLWEKSLCLCQADLRSRRNL
jgi:hypothetical protein